MNRTDWAEDTQADAPAIDVGLLEPVLRELVEVSSLRATLLIVEVYGGTRLNVPKVLEADHPLARLVGLQEAQQIARRFGGDRPLVPKALRALTAIRDTQIKANAEGHSVPELARRHGLGERRIYQIRGEAEPEANPNRSLFD